MTNQRQEYEHLYSGSFCVYYGFTTDTQQHVVLILERGAKFKGTKTEGFGVPGGFIDIQTRAEQPRESAVRELKEEVIEPDGSSVLDSIDPSRLKIVDSGIDYSGGQLGGLHAGTVWHGHKCELTPAEMQRLKVYAARMAADPAYADAVRAASHQELGNALLIPARTLLDKISRHEMKFAYPHEKHVVTAVAATLPHPAPQALPAPKV